jgi:D-3-phosphoglycerate dehydrogenase
MTANAERSVLLVAPHKFDSMDTERAVAAECGADLIESGDEREFRAAIPRARVIMMSAYAKLDGEAIRAAGSCVAIVRIGAGVDNIDVETATALGIPVANVPDAAVEEVAMHAVGMVTALARRLPAADAALRGGSWSSELMLGVRRFSSLTAGVVGLGRIGSLTARHLECLGASVIVHDPAVSGGSFERAELDELIVGADIVSLHLPLLPATANLLSRERIASMKPGAIVVNVSRGGLIDEVALAEALSDGHLGGAGIDVFGQEPLPLDHPLRFAPNTILTPHVAWRADESAFDYQAKAAEQARQALTGAKMSNVLNPDAYAAEPKER